MHDSQFQTVTITDAEKPFVKILICIPLGNHPKYEAAKRACLETWLSSLKALPESECQYFFVKSDTSLEMPTVVNDILLVPSEDGYYFRIQEKIQWFTQWALRHFRFQHIFKCDPDTFLYTQRWLDLIQTHSEQHLIGFPYGPYDDVPNFPSGGAGYFFSYHAAQILAQGTLGKYGPEEQDIAAILFKEGNISLTPCYHLDPGAHDGSHIPGTLEQPFLASTHYIPPDAMYKLYEHQNNPSLPYNKSLKASGSHPHWKSDMYFYSSGKVGRTISGYLEGTWAFTATDLEQFTPEKLTIYWLHWPEETWIFDDEGKVARHEQLGEASQLIFKETFRSFQAERLGTLI